MKSSRHMAILKIIKENDVLKEVEIEAKYFDVNFKYKRKYVYQDKK